jgi:hypothetical protein
MMGEVKAVEQSADNNDDNELGEQHSKPQKYIFIVQNRPTMSTDILLTAARLNIGRAGG